METSKLEQLKIEREPEREDAGVGGWIVGLVLAAVAVGALSWWWFTRTPVLEVATVTARAVQGAAANTVLNASGYVTARRQATVSSKFTAQVREVFIEEGMAVEEGQVLARLDDANLRRSLELAEARLHAAETARKETEALLREARANFERTREIVERQLASAAELDRTRAAADSLA
ncbi:MAG: biotin/lipoyl-binding protein, partial [Gammaproteobacteria bacterium]